MRNWEWEGLLVGKTGFLFFLTVSLLSQQKIHENEWNYYQVKKLRIVKQIPFFSALGNV